MCRSQLTLILGFCVALCVVLSGCGAQEESVLVVSATESVFAKMQAEVEPIEEEILVEEVSGEGGEEEGISQPESGLFEPPFPDRIELFVAPKREGRGTRKLGDAFENAVELLGFVNVDEQRVVLSISGLVSSLAEGGLEAGIEVISIQPPAVVLQRGRQRWQVTLEN